MLVLKEKGRTFEPGPEQGVGVTLVVEFGACLTNPETEADEGVLDNNSAKMIEIGSVNTQGQCFDSYQGKKWTRTGGVSHIQLTAKGKATLFMALPPAALEINAWGPAGDCIYEFSKLKGTFAVPGTTIITGTGTGKLTGSPKACAKKVTTKFVSDIFSFETFPPLDVFETALA